MTVEAAVNFALSDPDPQARAAATIEIVGRLLTVLHRKGVLLPSELVEVLGKHDFEEYYAKAETPTRE